ncbi:MAG: DUF2797 domain-containing protein [Gammaproteobacteria bacterium]|nr:DUF2797 domain-containing protein [Gammaproteobacteria bacterium]
MTVGNIQKMTTKLTDTVEYNLPIGNESINMNQFIGKQITLRSTGTINCVHCGKKTNKSYSQGHCYPCMKKLASCDMCIMKPETCHYDQGTCREPEWGEANCMRPHYLYLANSSSDSVKVGITRETQIPTRWIDQGAVQALAIGKVQTRLQVGLLEVALKDFVKDKTDWRKMLKNDVTETNLSVRRDELFELAKIAIEEIQTRFGKDSIQLITDGKAVEINFPVLQYPEKVKAHNFDKTPEVSGILQGIKGQYLIFDTGVLNVRKFTGYEIELDV